MIVTTRIDIVKRQIGRLLAFQSRTQTVFNGSKVVKALALWAREAGMGRVIFEG
jgi:hypothetical protein